LLGLFQNFKVSHSTGSGQAQAIACHSEPESFTLFRINSAEAKNLALDRRFGHCNVRFFASLRSATKKHRRVVSLRAQRSNLHLGHWGWAIGDCFVAGAPRNDKLTVSCTMSGANAPCVAQNDTFCPMPLARPVSLTPDPPSPRPVAPWAPQQL
jgi:hypothetical protein